MRRKSLISTAVIPVAGLGTRFLPATKAQPKEMLAVVDKPVIQYIVEEAVAAGIRQIIFVTSHTKRAIEDHFDRNFELEYRLEQKKKLQELKTVAAVGKLARFAFVRQTKPLGDGDAVLAAVPFLPQNKPFAVLFGDDIIDANQPGIGQLMEVYAEYRAPVIAVERVPRAALSQYGVIGGIKEEKGVFRVNQFVEKPAVGKAPSNLGVVGRYIITPQILPFLTRIARGSASGKEIRLADALIAALEKKMPVFARELEGTRYDTGSKLGFLVASIEFGLRHSEIKQSLRAYLKKRCKEL
ncbi:UTP--glucose-1-phosphate uridylyltransferase [Candidatus Uhrbacteria bacterium]|nr:UTP--glucose-1-phosphate uridylyltransferase [Candidatus Uhrbacteria bacterium]